MKIHTDKVYSLLLVGIVFLGFLLRVVGIDWDQGFYLHPDERAIFLFTIPLSLPDTISAFFSPESSFNPKFFAYGSFPLYLLNFALFLASFFSSPLGGYEEGYVIGRTITVVLDTLTILLVYFLGKHLFSKTAGLLGAFFYAIAVFPIQNSHFYISDVFLTFFLLLSLLLFFYFLQNKKWLFLLFSSIACGVAVASKISALPFLLVIFVGLFLFFASSHRLFQKQNLQGFFRALYQFIFYFFVYSLVVFLTFFLLMPYAIIDFPTFLTQLSEQQKMTQSAFTFPYTLQYVGKAPYLYEIQQIFFWGLGMPLSILSFSGLGYFVAVIVRSFSRTHHFNKHLPWLLLLFFFLLYFGIVGGFAVGWMRYMLPLYPYLTLFSALFSLLLYRKILQSFHLEKKVIIRYGGVVIFLFLCSLWTLSFLKIYFEPHPRLAASEWIHEQIPPGSSLAMEHWDDNLPLYGIEQYEVITLPLYERDTPQKWENMSQLLERSDYIIVSSHRLYDPLTRLSLLCEDLPSEFCYQETSRYYRELFAEKMGYFKTAEFSSLPTIPLFHIPINDQGADESFTVYDHPKVVIFEKHTR